MATPKHLVVPLPRCWWEGAGQPGWPEGKGSQQRRKEGTSLTFNPLHWKATVTEQEIQRWYLGVKQPQTEDKNGVLKGMFQSSTSTGISPSCPENNLQTPNENSHV